MYTFNKQVFYALVINKAAAYAILGRLCSTLDAARATFVVVPLKCVKQLHLRVFVAPLTKQPRASPRHRRTASSVLHDPRPRLSYPSQFPATTRGSCTWHRAVEFHRASGRVDKGHQILDGPLGGWVVDTAFLRLLEHNITWTKGAKGAPFTFTLRHDVLQVAATPKCTPAQDELCTAAYVGHDGTSETQTVAYVRALCKDKASRWLHGTQLVSCRGKFALFRAVQAYARTLAAAPEKELALVRLLAGRSPHTCTQAGARVLFCNGQELDDSVHEAWGRSVCCRCGLTLPGGVPVPVGKHDWDARPGARGCAHAKKLAQKRAPLGAVNAPAKKRSKKKA